MEEEEDPVWAPGRASKWVRTGLKRCEGPGTKAGHGGQVHIHQWLRGDAWLRGWKCLPCSREYGEEAGGCGQAKREAFFLFCSAHPPTLLLWREI